MCTDIHTYIHIFFFTIIIFLQTRESYHRGLRATDYRNSVVPVPVSVANYNHRFQTSLPRFRAA